MQRRQVDAGAGLDRAGLPGHVQEALARHDVDDLVVGVAVVGRAADGDLAHELRESRAADGGIDEQPERAADAGLLGRAGSRSQLDLRLPSAGVSRSEGVGASTTSATSGPGPSFSIEYDSPDASRRPCRASARGARGRQGRASPCREDDIDCSWPALAEPCERPIGKDTTLCTSAWQPHAASIVVRVSTPSASFLGATSSCCTRCPGISCPRAPRGSEDLAGVVVEVLLLRRPRRAHDRVAVEQERHAAGELAVLAVVLDEPDPVRELALGSATSGKRRLWSAAKQRWSRRRDADPDERDVRGRVVVEGAVELVACSVQPSVLSAGSKYTTGARERPEIEPLSVARDQLADRELVADLDGLRHERPLLIKPAQSPRSDPDRPPITPRPRQCTIGSDPYRADVSRLAGQDLDQARAVDVAAGDDADDLARRPRGPRAPRPARARRLLRRRRGRARPGGARPPPSRPARPRPPSTSRCARPHIFGSSARLPEPSTNEAR